MTRDGRLSQLRIAWFVLVIGLIASTAPAFADGRVFKQIYGPVIETPDQQALIHFAERIEHLVIETTVSGAGTNFAWVVPLPSVPEITPVSEDFFANVQQAFRSRLIHDVHPYYISV